MRFHVGTSGYSYKEWKGSFYPEKFPEKHMLSFYAERFTTVEINATFYRMPTESLLQSWAAEVPSSFRFVLKAPEIITHRKRLKDVAQPMAEFVRSASAMKRQLGPLLFQLPPNFKKDVPRLQDFLQLIKGLTKGRKKTAFEFRHVTWFDDEVFQCLRKHKFALCIADADDDKVPAEIVGTAKWGYVRLRRASYTDAQLQKWIAQIKSQPWDEVYVFFKHEDSGTGPKFAARFLELAGS